MPDAAPEPPERLGPGFGVVSIGFATEDRGRVTFMWHTTREVSEHMLAELRERWGDPHQESIVDAALLDSAHATLFGHPGHVWVDHSQVAGDG